MDLLNTSASGIVIFFPHYFFLLGNNVTIKNFLKLSVADRDKRIVNAAQSSTKSCAINLRKA